MDRIVLGHLLALVLAIACCRDLAAADDVYWPRNEATFQAIVEATKERNRDVRMHAAHALGAMGKSEARPALEALAAEDPVPAVRIAALRSLCKLLPEGTRLGIVIEVPAESKAFRYAALCAAAQLDFEGREKLISDALDSGSVQERMAAISALEMNAASADMVEKALQDSHPAVYAQALRLLNEPKDEAVRSRLREAIGNKMSSEAFVIRAAACDAIGRMKIAAMIPELETAARDEHALVRRAASQALASFAGVRAAARVLEKGLVDPDYTVRVAACRSLGVLADPSSAQALAARLTDAFEEVRDAAEEALIKFSPDGAYAAVVPYARNTGDADARRRAWHVLGEYAHPATCDLAFETLPETLAEEDEVRVIGGYAIRILRKRDDRRMSSFLVNKLLVMPRTIVIPGPQPHEHTVGAPGNLQTTEGFLAASQFGLREPIGFARALINRGLGSGVLWPSGEPKAAAARYLGDIGHTESVDLLKRLFEKDKHNPIVAEACRDAVKKLTGEDLIVPVRDTRRYGDFFIEVKE